MTTNFDLRVRADHEPQRYTVEILASPAGEGAGITQSAPQVAPELLTAWQESRLTNTEAESFGKQLFEWLFPAPLLERFTASTSRLDSQNQVLRLRLRIEPPELSQLPWELCWNTHNEFMALLPDLAWVRYIAEPIPPNHLGTPTPLKLLIALASPSELPALDVDGEAALILDSLKLVGDLFQVKVLPHITTELLQEALAEGVDVLHFVGHGAINEAGEGFLAFEDDAGALDTITAQKLRALFRGRDVKMVVLNACQSAVAQGQEAIMAIAPSLVRSGIPAVIAQQAPVPDRLAKNFAKTLYDYLAKGRAVDEIITEMRIRAYVSAGDYAHWGIPVLFMRSPDGKLWQSDTQKSDGKTRPMKEQKGGVNISGINNSQIKIGTVVGGDMVEGSTPADDDLRQEGDAEE
jgi:hypothetical protein